MSNSQQPLSDVLYWFSLEEEKPTAALVDEYCTRFPEYADAITTFAIELAVDAVGRSLPALDVEAVAGPPSLVVLRAISDFQNARYQSATETRSNDLEASSKVESAAAIINPFSSLDSKQFRELTRNIDANSIFVTKLRDRQIIPLTIPMGFTKYVAKELGVSEDLMIAHFSSKPAQQPSRIFYKAVDKPTVSAQQTFEEAVRTSGLSPGQQARLLKF